MYEALMSTNNFNMPNVLKDNDATYVLLVRLILLEPGTIQSHPNMGVGLISKYRYSAVQNIGILEQNISNQIATYLPDLQNVQVSVTSDKKFVIIDIQIDDLHYTISMNKQTYSLENI